MHEICHDSIAIYYNLSIQQLLSKQLAELPTITDSFYSTTTTSIRWGQAGSHKVASKGYVSTKSSQMAFIGTIFTFTYHPMQLNPWPNSSVSRVVNYSWLSVRQRELELFEDHLSSHGCLTSLKSKPQQKQLG